MLAVTLVAHGHARALAQGRTQAVGTGVTATSQQAQDAHAFVRSLIADLYGADAAAKIRIQYGGSVKPANAAELFSQPDVDGGLIGGASLVAQDFLAIAAAAAR